MGLRGLLGILCGVGCLLSCGAAQASPNGLKAALQDAPSGIKLHDIFRTGTTTTKNAAGLLRDSPARPLPPNTDVVSVTNNVNQFGTIWSTDANVFDLTQDAQASMWLYLGTERGKAADGLAFVLQNDARGLAAQPTFTGGMSGETLGVWGVDRHPKWTATSQIAATAIQRSWALEFDTHENVLTDPGAAASFDFGAARGPHIASNYPGEADTYKQRRGGRRGNYFTMVHNGVVQDRSKERALLADGQWHHLTLRWEVAGALRPRLTYSFDDKDPETGGQKKAITNTVVIDPTKIDPQHTGRVRWGFTGATGAVSSNNLVIFEGVPGLVNATASAELTNLSTAKQVVAAGQVRSGDDLQLDYQLTYAGGKRDWEALVAELHLPQGIAFKSGTITYANGQAQVLDPAALQATSGRYHQRLATLSRANPTAVISLRGTAQAGTQTVNVARQVSRFQAPDAVATANSPAFRIQPRVELALTGVPHTIRIPASGTETITGVVRAGEHQRLPEQLWVHPRLNGKVLAKQRVTADGRLSYAPPATALRPGSNYLELYVADELGNESATVTVELIRDGILAFAVVRDQSSFVTTRLTGTMQRVWHANDWRVQVSDTRTAGSQWALQATTTAFETAQGETLDGQLWYHGNQGSVPVTTRPTTVHRGQANAERVTDVTADWDRNAHTGLELRLSGRERPGRYRGTVTWTLTDAPT